MGINSNFRIFTLTGIFCGFCVPLVAAQNLCKSSFGNEIQTIENKAANEDPLVAFNRSFLDRQLTRVRSKISNLEDRLKMERLRPSYSWSVNQLEFELKVTKTSLQKVERARKHIEKIDYPLTSLSALDSPPNAGEAKNDSESNGYWKIRRVMEDLDRRGDREIPAFRFNQMISYLFNNQNEKEFIHFMAAGNRSKDAATSARIKVQEARAKIIAILTKMNEEKNKANNLSDATNDFDFQNYPAATTFLKSLHILSFPKTWHSGIDLSSKFYPPKLQRGRPICVARAIVSEMETFPSISKGLSAEYLYALAHGNDRERGLYLSDTLFVLERSRICDEESFSSSPKNLSHLKIVQHLNYGVKDFAYLSSENIPRNIQFFRMLLEFGMTVSIGIDTDGIYKRVEDWEYVGGVGGGHSMNIVGYGEGVDPEDLQIKPYFIVRDSDADFPMHYKIGAQSLVQQLQDVTKILDLDIASSSRN